MKATGIVRRVDELGRVVIPKEVRKTLHIREGDPLELFVEDGNVVFKKYMPYDKAFFDRIYNIIVKKIKLCAVFDSMCCCKKSNGFELDDYVPEHWKFYHSANFTEDGNMVYSIRISNEIIGYVAVKESDNCEFIEGVVSAVSFMEDY